MPFKTTDDIRSPRFTTSLDNPRSKFVINQRVRLAYKKFSKRAKHMVWALKHGYTRDDVGRIVGRQKTRNQGSIYYVKYSDGLIWPIGSPYLKAAQA